ncbi:MAG: TIGR02099 family protein [Xanthomonadales bacterium]|nr:TIGR02099 family protein [Xanthomonadales bacterium]
MAWRRRLRRTVLFAVAGLLIGLAVLVGLVQLALPWWASDPDRVARLLSSRLATPVRIDAVQPVWSGRGPRIVLDGVRLGTGDAEVVLGRAEWAIDLAGALLPGRHLSEFRLDGLDLVLEQSADGTWEVLGLPELFKGPTRPLRQILDTLPAFALYDSRLTVRGPDSGAAMVVELASLRRLPGSGPVRWRGRVLSGEAGAAQGEGLTLALDLQGTRGLLHVRGERLSLSDWLAPLPMAGLRPADGQLAVDAWLRLEGSGIESIRLSVRSRGSRWTSRTPVMGPDDGTPAGVSLPALRLDTHWWRSGAGGELAGELVLGEGPPARLAGRTAEGLRSLHVRDLPLSAWLPVLAQVDALPPLMRQWLRESGADARIDGVDLHFEGPAIRQYAVRVTGLRAAPAAGLPGLDGLGLRMRGDPAGLVAWLEPDPVVIAWPGVFAAPVQLVAGPGVLAGWQHPEGGWTFGSDGLVLRLGEGEVELAGAVDLHAGQAPLVDAGARVSATSLQSVKPFWPLNRIPNTAAFLNRALTAGELSGGRVWLRGPVDRFPFAGNEGRLDASASVRGAGLDYHPDWPALSGIDADLQFENLVLDIQGRRAQVMGMRLARASARVDDLRDAVFRIQAQGQGSGEALMAVLRATPVQSLYGDQIAGMALAGEPRVDLEVAVPSKPELGRTEVDGRVVFSGSERYTDSVRGLVFGDLRGSLAFTRTGLSAEQLALSLAGEPAQLALRIGSPTVDPEAAVEAELTGRVSASALFARVPGLAPLLTAARGRADWRVRLHVPDEGDGWLRAESDLRGIALRLPAPLAKEADSVLPLRLQTGLAEVDRRIDLRLGPLLRLRARLPGPGQPLAGALALGGAEPEQIPDSGFVVTGQVPALDLSGWLAFEEASGPPPAPVGTGDDADADAGPVVTRSPPEDAVPVQWPQVILRVGELGVLGRSFREVDVQMRPGEGQVRVDLRGPDIDGQVLWSKAAAGRVVRGQLARLHVPEGPGGAAGGVGAPDAMPGLDLAIDDLRVGAVALGQARLEAAVAGDAFEIRRFETRSPAFDMDATGNWRRSDGRDLSTMRIDLAAEDLGRMLEVFGFARLVEGGRTRIGIEGSWRGSPAAFALEVVDGRLTVKVESGRIAELDPGVGRLFGLLNLREIPRRLILDFRDFFSQGLRFNSIEGEFALNVGEAYTDNVVLKSSSADILFTGRTGLIMRDYDQMVEVTPRLGGTLPVVGAIAGGPAGAAAGLIAQGILRVDQATKAVYRVSGSWDEPVIVKQEPAREQRGRRADPDPRPGADPGTARTDQERRRP